MCGNELDDRNPRSAHNLKNSDHISEFHTPHHFRDSIHNVHICFPRIIVFFSFEENHQVQVTAFVPESVISRAKYTQRCSCKNSKHNHKRNYYF